MRHMNWIFRVLGATGVVLASAASAAPSYFGYVNSSLAGVGDYTTQVAPYANLGFISDPNPINVANYLSELENQGLSSIVDVSTVFFDQSVPSQWQLRSQTDYTSLWSTFKSHVGPYVPDIAAFYPDDEPNAHGVSTSWMQTVANVIHADYPATPIATIYVGTPAGPYPGLSAYNYFGIDCYSNGQFRCNNTNPSVSYSAAYQYLRSQLVSGQRMLIVPQAGYNAQQTSTIGCCNTALQAEVDRLYQLALADADVVAVLPFIWEVDPGVWDGVSNYPGTAMLTSFETIGAQVKSGFAYPAGIQPISRFLLGNLHFPTANVVEGLNAGYQFEEIGFNTYTASGSGEIPLYRCYDSGTGSHFASKASNCEGQKGEGLYGYIHASQVGGTTALYRFYNSTTDDHLETTNYTEGTGDPGYHLEEVLGYSPVVGFAE